MVSLSGLYLEEGKVWEKEPNPTPKRSFEVTSNNMSTSDVSLDTERARNGRKHYSGSNVNEDSFLLWKTANIANSNKKSAGKPSPASNAFLS